MSIIESNASMEVNGSDYCFTDDERGVLDFAEFYGNGGKNANGVSMEMIFRYDDTLREAVHNFTQWLFPIDSWSKYEPNAPIVNYLITFAFKWSEQLRDMQIRAFIFMLDHYGLRYVGDEIKKGELFEIRKQRLASGNHNLLRITRILRSLYLLDQKTLALNFFKFLMELHPTDVFITTDTRQYWENAVSE